jgi:hypothetical protein
MIEEFLQQRSSKVFECRFSAASPDDLLSIATEALAAIRNETGSPEWKVARNLQHLRGVPGGFHAFHTVSVKIAKFFATVGLTLQAIPLNSTETRDHPSRHTMRPQGPLPVAGERYGRPGRQDRRQTHRDEGRGYPCHVAAHFEGGGWDYGLEEYVDVAMEAIASGLDMEFPQNTGWYVTRGVWRLPHRFQVKTGPLPAMPTWEPEPAFHVPKAPLARPPRERSERGSSRTATWATIAAAIAAARPGATVTIPPGRYREMLRLDKPVKLVGGGPPGSVVLTGSQSWPVITAGHSVEICNLTIESQFPEAVLVEGGLTLDRCTVRGTVEVRTPVPLRMQHCTIDGASLELLPGASAAIANTTFSGAEYEAIRVADGEISLQNVTFDRCGKCAISAGNSTLVLDGCRVNHSRYGLIAQRSNISLQGCVIDTAEEAIYLDAISKLHLVETRLSHQPRQH